MNQVPAICLSVSMALSGLYTDPSFQLIAIALFIGKVSSIAFAECMYLLSQPPHYSTTNFNSAQAAVFSVNSAVFAYCRWYLFPKYGLQMVQDMGLRKHMLEESKVTGLLFLAGTAIIMYNNITITRDVVDAILSIQSQDDKNNDVPSARDSKIMASFISGDYRGRRSSLLRIVEQSIDFQNRRRSSVEALRWCIDFAYPTNNTDDQEKTRSSD